MNDEIRLAAQVALVGREAAQEQLQGLVHVLAQQAAAGLCGWTAFPGRVAVISGPVGSGKNAVSEWFMQKAREKELAVFTAESRSYGEPVPYFEIVKLLRDFYAIQPSDHRQHVKDKIKGHPEIVFDDAKKIALLTDFILTSSTRAADLSSAVSARRDLIFNCVYSVFAAQLRKQPACVILKGLERADQGTLDLLLYLVERLRDMPIIWGLTFATAPNGDYPDDVELFLAGTVMRRAAVTVPLEPLPPEQRCRLAAALAGAGETGPRLSGLLSGRPYGNPLFLIETLRLLNARNKLAVRATTLILDEDINAGDLPATLPATLAERFALLSMEHKEFLEIASIIGEKFNLPVIRVISKFDPETCRRYAAELTAFDIIRVRDAAAERYAFKFKTFKDIAYEQMDDDLRKILHERMADDLAHKPAELRERYTDLIAHHYQNSDNREVAVAYYLQAAENAAALHENFTAIDYYTSALDILREIGAERPQKIQEINEQLGYLNAIIGEWEKAIRCFSENLKTAWDTHSRHAIAVATMQIGSVYYKRGLANEALENFDASLEIASELSDPELTSRIDARLGMVYASLNILDKAKTHYEQALAAKHELRSDENITSILGGLGRVHRGLREYDTAITYYNQAMALNKRENDDFGLSITVSGLARVLEEKGELDQALAMYEESLRLGKYIGTIRGIAISYLNIGRLAKLKGDHNAAIINLQKSLDLSRRYHNLTGVSISSGYLAEIYEQLGDEVQAIDLYHQQIKVNLVTKYYIGIVMANLRMGQLYARLGNYERAAACLEFSLELRSFDRLRVETKREIYTLLARYFDRLQQPLVVDKYRKLADGLAGQ